MDKELPPSAQSLPHHFTHLQRAARRTATPGLHIAPARTSHFPAELLCRAEDTCSALCPPQTVTTCKCRGKGQVWPERCQRARVSSTRAKGRLTNTPSDFSWRQVSPCGYSRPFAPTAKTHKKKHRCSKRFQK